MKILQTIKQKRIARQNKKYPKWGSPIIDIYAYNGLLVVATKLDLFVSEDGVYFERVVTGEQGEQREV